MAGCCGRPLRPALALRQLALRWVVALRPPGEGESQAVEVIAELEVHPIRAGDVEIVGRHGSAV
jgi:hypothetical protein